MYWAKYRSTNGISQSTFVGSNAGQNSSSTNTVAVGFQASRNVDGTENTFVGWNAGEGASSAAATLNVGIGAQSLYVISSGASNVGVGHDSLKALTTGSNNVAIGDQAGDSLTTGSNNIVIGHEADASSATVSNEMTLGDANITSLRIPGLQSGASNGQVLTFNSTNGNITLADAGGGGASEINDLSDAVTKDSGVTIGLGTGALANDDDSD